MRARWIVLSIVGVAAAGVGYSATRPDRVETAVIAPGTVIEAVYASGTVQPVERVEVKATVAGTVVELPVMLGGAVTRGQVVARIDAPSLRHEVERERADVVAAEARARGVPQVAVLAAQSSALAAQLREARREVGHLRALVGSGAAAPAELARARVNAAQIAAQLSANRAQQREARIASRNEVSRAQAQLASVASRADAAEVRSPIAGVVLVRRVEPGEVVGVNHPLLRVGDLAHLQVEVQAAETEVGRLRPGMPVAVRLPALGDRTYPGRLASIAPDADVERRTFALVVSFDAQPEGLRPGMTAEVDVIVARRDRVIVAPVEAVHDARVWVVDPESHVRSRTVRVGIRDLSGVEILSGLRAGDRVVLDPPAELREGASVNPQTVAHTGTAPDRN